MDLSRLTEAQLVRLSGAIAHSRGAAKRCLHEFGLPMGSGGVDDAIAALAKRPDAAALRRKAGLVSAGEVARVRAGFDPLADLRREIARTAEGPDALVARVAVELAIVPDELRGILDGSIDAPLSRIVRIVKAANARHVHFAHRHLAT